jgi:hypothetical protein
MKKHSTLQKYLTIEIDHVNALFAPIPFKSDNHIPFTSLYNNYDDDWFSRLEQHVQNPITKVVNNKLYEMAKKRKRFINAYSRELYELSNPNINFDRTRILNFLSDYFFTFVSDFFEICHPLNENKLRTIIDDLLDKLFYNDISILELFKILKYHAIFPL